MRRTFFAAGLAAVFLLSGLQTTRAVTTSATPTPAPVLQAPTNLQAVRNSAGAIALTWRDNSTGELGYKVERKVNASAFAQIFRGTTPNQQSYTDDPRLGGTYQYRVRAYAVGVGDGTFSNVASVTLRIPTATPRPSSTPSPTATPAPTATPTPSPTATPTPISTPEAPTAVYIYTSSFRADTNDVHLEWVALTSGDGGPFVVQRAVDLPSFDIYGQPTIDPSKRVFQNIATVEPFFKGEGVVIYTFNDIGVLPDVSYAYRVVSARNANVVSSAVELRTPLGDYGTPQAPRNLQVTAVYNSGRQTQVSLLMDDPNPYTAQPFYSFEHAINGGAWSVFVEGINFLNPGDQLSDVPADATVSYRARVYLQDAQGNRRYSPYSDAITVKLNDAFGFYNFVGSASGSRVMLTWKSNFGQDATLFRSGPDGYITRIVHRSAGQSAPFLYSFSETLPDGVYSYWLDQQSVTLRVGLAPMLPAPTNLRTTFVGARIISLAWDFSPPSAVPDARFRVERQTGTGAWSTLGETAQATFDDSTAQHGTSYNYRVRAFIPSNPATEPSNAVSAQLLDKPAPPSFNSTYATYRSVQLTWNPVRAEPTSYTVYRVNDDNSVQVVANVPTSTDFYKSVEVGGLQPSTPYRFYLTATVDGHESAPGNTVTVITQAVPNINLFVTKSVASPSGIALSWADGGDNTSFTVLRSTDGADFSPLATVSASAPPISTYSDSGLTRGAKYYYKIRGVQRGNESQVQSGVAGQLPPPTLYATQYYEGFGGGSGFPTVNPKVSLTANYDLSSDAGTLETLSNKRYEFERCERSSSGFADFGDWGMLRTDSTAKWAGFQVFDTTVQSGKTYSYRVRARATDAAGTPLVSDWATTSFVVPVY